MNPIGVGAKAPDFNLVDQHEQNVRLTDFQGRKVLLSWHPLAWTSICTDQMRALDTYYEEFERLNTIPLGFSVDSSPCKKAWAAALNIQRLRMPADFWPHGKVAQDYGIFDEQEGISARANILVDEQGMVQWVKVYPNHELPDIQEVFRVLRGEL